jgi:hypothetical protein
MPPDAQRTWDSLTWDSTTWDAVAETQSPPHPLPNDNRISAELTAANVTAILTKFTEIKTLLPFLLNLTKDERIRLPKLGASSLAFDEQCQTYMASSPNLVPPYVTVAEVDKDRALRVQVAEILREGKKLTEALGDTLMVIGSEIWLADLSFYQSVRQAARRDVLGADTVYDDLKERFPGVSGDPEEDEEEETPPPTP